MSHRRTVLFWPPSAFASAVSLSQEPANHYCALRQAHPCIYNPNLLHYLAQVLQLVPLRVLLRVQEQARVLQLALAPVLVLVQRLAVQQAVFLALALALALVLLLGRAAGLEVQGVGWQVLQEQDKELYLLFVFLSAYSGMLTRLSGAQIWVRLVTHIPHCETRSVGSGQPGV